MKKIINGRVYDTETAIEKGYYENTPYRSEFSWYCETLYQKKTGEFFLHGEGHAASKYSRCVSQNEWAAGEKIIPLTYSDAQKWAAEHLDGDEYEVIFGEISEDETKRSLNVNISTAAAEKLKKISAQTGKPVSALIEEYVQTL